MSVVALLRDAGVPVAAGMDIRLGSDGKLKGAGLTPEARAFVSENRAAVLALLAVDALALWTGEYVGSPFWVFLFDLYAASDQDGRRAVWAIEDAIAVGDRARASELVAAVAAVEFGDRLMGAVAELFGVPAAGRVEPQGGVHFDGL
jgi:hypothetical protein